TVGGVGSPGSVGGGVGSPGFAATTDVVTEAGGPSVTPGAADRLAVSVSGPGCSGPTTIWNWGVPPAPSVPTLKSTPDALCEPPPRETIVAEPGTNTCTTTPVAVCPLGFEAVTV